MTQRRLSISKKQINNRFERENKFLVENSTRRKFFSIWPKRKDQNGVREEKWHLDLRSSSERQGEKMSIDSNWTQKKKKNGNDGRRISDLESSVEQFEQLFDFTADSFGDDERRGSTVEWISQTFTREISEQRANGSVEELLRILFVSIRSVSAELSADAKLDDAYLKMKRLDKALEEAFEKEKQVKF